MPHHDEPQPPRLDTSDQARPRATSPRTPAFTHLQHRPHPGRHQRLTKAGNPPTGQRNQNTPRAESPEESIADADFVSIKQPHVQLDATPATRRAPDLAASTRATNAEPTSANRDAPEPPPAGRHTTSSRQDATSDFNACDAGGTHPTTTRAGTFSSNCRLKPEPDHGPRQRRNITSAANFPS